MKSTFKNAILCLILFGFAGAAYSQSRPAEGAFRSRLVGEFSSDYYLGNSYEAIKNMLELTAPRINQFGICKEIGIFVTSINALKSNVEHDPDIKATAQPSEIEEIATLYTLANELQTFCGDALDGGRVNKTREGNYDFLKAQMQQIEPHLLAVTRFTQSYFSAK